MTKAKSHEPSVPLEPAQIVREYGPFGADEPVHGVTYDGQRVWFATGRKLRALEPARAELSAELDVTCDAGTAFDGEYLYQLAAGRIQKLDPHTGKVLASLAVPGGGSGDDAGLAWAEGTLWLAKYSERKIHQLDPNTGEVLRTIESNRYVTGVTWVEGELWHGTFEQDVSELRRVRADDGEVLTRLQMPAGTMVSGLEWDGGELLYCGGGKSGKLRAVKRPSRR